VQLEPKGPQKKKKVHRERDLRAKEKNSSPTFALKNNSRDKKGGSRKAFRSKGSERPFPLHRRKKKKNTPKTKLRGGTGKEKHYREEKKARQSKRGGKSNTYTLPKGKKELSHKDQRSRQKEEKGP